jgi:hypothetical protein
VRHTLVDPSRDGAGDPPVLLRGRVFLSSRRDCSYSTDPETCRGEDTEERVVGGVLVGASVVELGRIGVVPSAPAARIQGPVGRWRKDSAVVAWEERREIFVPRWGILLSFVCCFVLLGKERVLLSLP